MGRRTRSRTRSGGGPVRKIAVALLLLGAVSVVGATAVSSFAFSSVQGDRGANVNVAADDEALVGIELADDIEIGDECEDRDEDVARDRDDDREGRDNRDPDDDEGRDRDDDREGRDHRDCPEDEGRDRDDDREGRDHRDRDDDDDGDDDDDDGDDDDDDDGPVFLIEVTNNFGEAATITVSLTDATDGTLFGGSQSGSSIEVTLDPGESVSINIAPSDTVVGDIELDIEAQTVGGGGTVSLTRSVGTTQA